ncbi:MAG: hypothetical protein H0X44_01685 [Acidobacteria bacterium]|nr:hypothetical protein [Acidobacteriota bacterium]
MAQRRMYKGRERRQRPQSDDVEPVVLTRKLADVIDDVVLAGHRVGDRVVLAKRQAALLIAEGWARRVAPHERRGRACACGQF